MNQPNPLDAATGDANVKTYYFHICAERRITGNGIARMHASIETTHAPSAPGFMTNISNLAKANIAEPPGHKFIDDEPMITSLTLLEVKET